MKNFTQNEIQKFQSRVVNRGDCVLWTGYLDKDGYGTMFFRGAARKAHRIAWFSVHGEIQKGYVINHTCRNRACVNPQHLQLITAAQNSMKDSRSVGYINSQKTVCKNGHPYDSFEKTGKRKIRTCSICRKAKQKIARIKRYKAAKSALNV